MKLRFRATFQFVFIASLLTCTYDAGAQNKEPYIYTELGLGEGTEGMFKATLNTVFSGNNIISFSYCYASKKATNIPSDYDPNGLFGASWPQQSISAFGLSYGKLCFTRRPNTRFTLKGGITAGTVSKPYNYEPVPASGGWFSFGGPGEYTYSITKLFTMGIVLDPTIEAPLCRGFGLSAGPYVNLNPINPMVGIDGCIMFGRVRGRRASPRP